MSDLSIAIKFAQENGYISAEVNNVEEWIYPKTLYIPVSDEMEIIGLPQFIEVNNGVARFLSIEQREKIIGLI